MFRFSLHLYGLYSVTNNITINKIIGQNNKQKKKQWRTANKEIKEFCCFLVNFYWSKKKNLKKTTRKKSEFVSFLNSHYDKSINQIKMLCVCVVFHCYVCNVIEYKTCVNSQSVIQNQHLIMKKQKTLQSIFVEHVLSLYVLDILGRVVFRFILINNNDDYWKTIPVCVLRVIIIVDIQLEIVSEKKKKFLLFFSFSVTAEWNKCQHFDI